MIRKDYTDQIINGITCLNRAKDKHAIYIWQCPRCSKTFETPVYNIKDGYNQIKSCGCLRKEQTGAMGKANLKPITPGAQFGDIVVLGTLDKHGKNGHVFSLCFCLLCNHEVEICSSSLRSGEATRCRNCRNARIGIIGKTHLKPIEPGTQFGDLVVLGQSDKRVGGKAFSLCICLLCKHETEIRSTSLRSRGSTRCRICGNTRVGRNEERLLNEIEAKNNIKLQRHYRVFFPDHFYEVDGYDETNNTIYEVYENYHNSQVQQDRKRQLDITQKLDCRFEIIHDRSH